MRPGEARQNQQTPNTTGRVETYVISYLIALKYLGLAFESLGQVYLYKYTLNHS